MKRIVLMWSLLLTGLVGPSILVKADEGVSIQQNTGPVADRLAIRELIESYNAAVIEKDAAKWIANWVDDGIWNLGGGNIEGKQRILESWLTIMAPYEYASVFAQPIFIQVADDKGMAQWHTNERLKLYSGDEMLAVGRYKDRYIRANGVWKIKQRDYSVVFTSARATASSEQSQP